MMFFPYLLANFGGRSSPGRVAIMRAAAAYVLYQVPAWQKRLRSPRVALTTGCLSCSNRSLASDF